MVVTMPVPLIRPALLRLPLSRRHAFGLRHRVREPECPVSRLSVSSRCARAISKVRQLSPSSVTLVKKLGMMNGTVRRGRDVTILRHFLGLDGEISRERRLSRGRNLPSVERLTSVKELLALLRSSITVVISVEEIRLFNENNLETARYHFNSPPWSTLRTELEIISQHHKIRTQVIDAITDGSSTVKTVSFIPGGVDHFRFAMDTLVKRWQEEVSTFCARLTDDVCRDSPLRHVHFDSKLCTGGDHRLNVTQLLNSVLHEISLPDLEEQGWKDLAAGLLENQILRVLTVRYHRRSLNTFLQTPSSIRQGVPISQSWATCIDTTMKTLCISLPNDFRADVRAEAQDMASMLSQIRSVSNFMIEYTPPEQPPKLLEFSRCLRQALAGTTHVQVLHLLIPFKSQELLEQIRWMQQLKELVLVFDLWGKIHLNAAKNMIRNSPALQVFGLRRQDPKRKLSFWKRLLCQEITKADIVDFLGHDSFDETRLRILSLRGWELVDGEAISRALGERLRAQPQLYIDLIGTGVVLKNLREPQVVPEISRVSERSSTLDWSSTHPSPAPPPQPGNNGSRHMSDIPGSSGILLQSAGASTTESSVFAVTTPIPEHGDHDASNIVQGPGSVYAATREQQQLQQQRRQLLRQQQQQQQLPRRQPCPPMPFSSFSLDKLQEATKNFANDALIGRGGFGLVYQGELTTDTSKREVAVKDLFLEGVNYQRVKKSFEAEVGTLGRLHHVNLVQLLGYCAEGERRLLVYEYMPNRSLDRWIFQDGVTEAKLPWRKLMTIAVGVARGLHYLHFECQPAIIHLDVKPQNILLDSKFESKVADFGIAKLVVDTERNLAVVTQAQGTKCYMAPEIYQGNRVTPKSDVYGFGVTLTEIVRGKKNTDMPTLDGDDDTDLAFPFWARKKFQTGDYMKVYDQLRGLSIPRDQEKEAQRMMCIAIACINDDVDKRPDMKKVLLMLEGREPILDPSQSRHAIRNDFRFYEPDVR